MNNQSYYRMLNKIVDKFKVKPRLSDLTQLISGSKDASSYPDVELIRMAKGDWNFLYFDMVQKSPSETVCAASEIPLEEMVRVLSQRLYLAGIRDRKRINMVASLAVKQIVTEGTHYRVGDLWRESEVTVKSAADGSEPAVNNEEVFIVPKRHHKITQEGHTISYEAGDMVSPVSSLHDDFWQEFYSGHKPLILTKSKAEALPKWMRAQKALELFTAEGSTNLS